MESIRRLHEEILKREYKAEKQRKEEMRYDQMDCLLLAGEEKTERTIPVCETVFPEKFADLNAVREVLLTPEKQVYALIAPAFMGQFGEGVSPGAIRAALKRAGLSGMVEVTATVVSDSVAAVVSGGIVVVAVAVRTVTAVATAAVVCVCGDCVSVGGMDIAGAVSAGVGRGSSGITSTGRIGEVSGMAWVWGSRTLPRAGIW